MLENKSFWDISPDLLLAMESELCGKLSDFVSFRNHTIYFPPDIKNFEPELLPQENKLLVPLSWRNKFLGMLILGEIDKEALEPLLPHLPKILDSILESLAIKSKIGMEQGTGLCAEENFYSYLEHEAASMHARFGDPGQTLLSSPLFKLCLGMLILTWPEAHVAHHNTNFDFCERAFAEMSDIVKSLAPPDGRAAALGRFEGRYEFGIIFHVSGRNICHKLARELKSAIESRIFRDELTGRQIKARLFAGYSLYPQDLPGNELRQPMLAQALILRDRARLAANFAAQANQEGIMSFDDILSKGGLVLENCGHGRYRINLGYSANAREGLIFEAREGSRIRGHIVIQETGANSSMAELVYVERAGYMPEAGNSLHLIDSRGKAANLSVLEILGEGMEQICLAESDKRPRLLTHAEFLSQFARESARISRFALGIARMRPQNAEDAGFADINVLYSRIVDEFGKGQGETNLLAPLLAGRYGANSLVFFHCDLEERQILDFYRRVGEMAKNLQFSFSAGIFQYPFLNFGKEESEAYALKALEYAQLLPEPHIGILDSLALNINADKLYSLGDTFGAIEEYKLALLADSQNVMARNSLGVCMADIGKREEAVKLFKEALEQSEDRELKAKIFYNLGVVFQKRNEPASARKYYTQCVRLEPAHVYAWFRLGKINEKIGLRKAARVFYEHAAVLAEDNPELRNVAERQLARLEEDRGDREKARELLHDALLREPEDAAAMLELAKSYLEDDLAIAEMFARKSAAIAGSAEAWKLLATILVEQGKKEEALKAEARAGKS